MAVQIYKEIFYVTGNAECSYGQEMMRNEALGQINKFFIKHDRFDVINIIEDWDMTSRIYAHLYLIVYYKDYI